MTQEESRELSELRAESDALKNHLTNLERSVAGMTISGGKCFSGSGPQGIIFHPNALPPGQPGQDGTDGTDGTDGVDAEALPEAAFIVDRNGTLQNWKFNAEYVSDV